MKRNLTESADTSPCYSRLWVSAGRGTPGWCGVESVDLNVSTLYHGVRTPDLLYFLIFFKSVDLNVFTPYRSVSF